LTIEGVVGTTTPYYALLLTWLVKTIILAFICAFIAWLGIRVLDTLTPDIEERERIGENPVSVGLFIAGFFILVGLVIHGAATTSTLLGASISDQATEFLRRLGLIAASFFVSLLVGVVMLRVIDRLTPRIPFMSVAQSSLGVGIYVFGYLTFLGLIMHAALTTAL